MGERILGDLNAPVTVIEYASLTCPHCTAAHPHVAAIPVARPWVTLHELEVSSNQDNARRFQEIVEQGGMEDAAGVPAFLFCLREGFFEVFP